MSDYANHRLHSPIYVQVVYPSSGNRLRPQHSRHAVTEWLHEKVVDSLEKKPIWRFSASHLSLNL